MTINVPKEIKTYIEQAVAAGKFSSPEELIREAVELLQQRGEPHPSGSEKRQGGQWRDQVHIAADFDELPEDFAEPFGIQ